MATQPDQQLVDIPEQCPRCRGTVRDKRQMKAERGNDRWPDFDCVNPDKTCTSSQGKSWPGCGWCGWLTEEARHETSPETGDSEALPF